MNLVNRIKQIEKALDHKTSEKATMTIIWAEDKKTISELQGNESKVIVTNVPIEWAL